jgi:hypothetical protein
MANLSQDHVREGVIGDEVEVGGEEQRYGHVIEAVRGEGVRGA